MAAMTARQKFEKPSESKLKQLESSFAGVPAGALLYISTPSELDATIRAIPAGTVMTVPELRDDLAGANGADATCPVTTAIFLRVVAEFALEQLADGAPIDEVTPFWRVIDPSGPIAERIPGSAAFINAQRAAEGD